MACAALDQSLDLIAVVDGDGVIVLTNAAWRASADGFDQPETLGLGVNYLDVCERCDAAAVAAGIRSVLDGERLRFEIDYPAHSPTEDAWFALEVTSVDAPDGGAVLTHSNVTARVGTERARTQGRALDSATMLATTTSGVPGLAQMLADAQSEASSFCVALITFFDLGEIESRHGRRCRDQLVVHAVARVMRLTRGDDVMIRPSSNQLMLFARLANADAAEFLRGRLVEVLNAPYLVGPSQVSSRAKVEVAASDQFSTLDSLMRELAGIPGHAVGLPSPTMALQAAAPAVAALDHNAESNDTFAPLAVYGLPDGMLQSANRAAMALLGLAAVEPGRLHARDISDPIGSDITEVALVALQSGATDSYRAHRTVLAGGAPLAVLTSARRLVIASGALAVVLTVPVNVDNTQVAGAEDPSTAALVAGTIDAHGAVSSLSLAMSPMEAELTSALDVSLKRAAHAADVGIVDEMLETLGRTGSAAGELRLPHSELGWVACQLQLFVVRGPAAASDPHTCDAGLERFAFVLSASVGTRPMLEKIARLEGHIRRIGSEVHAAGVALAVSAGADRPENSLLDSLDLSVRQREIVERLLRGQRVSTISAALYISQSTVRNHLARVYRLVGVHSQEALLDALRAA